jgi:secreted Zn-dependent insulinase-like peptidase
MKAFPKAASIELGVPQLGMDLRDYFAAAYLANKWCACASTTQTAKVAYEIADEMMKAREQR